MKNIFNLILFTSFLIGCSNHTEQNIKNDSPFSIVVKLISAESIMDFEASKKYIDVKEVYKKFEVKDSITAEEVWINKIKFEFSLGKSKLFTNNFLYHKYHINESINGNNSTVEFRNKNSKITYKLKRKSKMKPWIIIGIYYR